MNTQEQARSMLADEFEASGHNKIAADVRRGPMPGHSTPLWMDEALRTIEKALTLSSTPRARELLPSFKDAWAKKVVEGYHYGGDALENVAFGYEIARKELAAALTAPVSEGS